MLHAGFDRTQMSIGLVVWVDFETPQRGSEWGLFVPNLTTKEIGERVGRIGRNEQCSVSIAGRDEGQRACSGRFANPSLPSHEDQRRGEQIA